MPKEQSIEVVDRSGGRIWIADNDGVRDNLNRLAYREVTVMLTASSVDAFVFSPLEGVWQVTGVRESHTVVGGSGATVQVVVCTGSVAIGSGVAQLTGALDLTVTAPANRAGTLIASPTEIYICDSVGIDMSGTLTGLVGQVTIGLKRIR